MSNLANDTDSGKRPLSAPPLYEAENKRVRENTLESTVKIKVKVFLKFY